MKKILLLVSLVFSASGNAQNCFNYFEGTINCLTVTIDPDSTNVWEIGVPSKTIFSSAASAPNALCTGTSAPYPANNQSAVTFSFIIYPNYYSFHALQWKQKMDLEKHKDAAVIEFSLNQKQTWQNAHNNPNVHQNYGFPPSLKDTIDGDYCFSGIDTTWRDMWLCFRFISGGPQDTLFVRFTLKSDSNDTKQEGWMIDNLTYHRTISHPVREFSKDEDVVVYPNVTSGILNVEHRKTEVVHPISSMDLLDARGNVLEQYGPNYAKVVLDIRTYPNGNYYLRVITGKKTKTFRIVLQKE